jgi:predicted GIY-YIG superfamily endonuclease
LRSVQRKRASLFITDTAAFSSGSNANAKDVTYLMDKYQGKVLLVGEGDFGFAKALSLSMQATISSIPMSGSGMTVSSLTATTLDLKESVLYNFPQRAQENLAALEMNKDKDKLQVKVQYGVDAVQLPISFPRKHKHEHEQHAFNTIGWNFPHINGKQNIRKNRKLVCDFLASAKNVLAPNGKVLLLLCDTQAGTSCTTTTDWLQSWKITEQASDSGFLLTEVNGVDISPLERLGYSPKGRRGKDRNFSTYLGDNAVLLTLECPSLASLSISSSNGDNDSNSNMNNLIRAEQAPLYVHETHLLSSILTHDVTLLETTAAAIIRQICSENGFPNSLWSCHMVDVYVCPRTRSVSHALQISYCSLTHPLGRAKAEMLKNAVENLLPRRLNVASSSALVMQSLSTTAAVTSSSSGNYTYEYWLRKEKTGGKPSKAHSWLLAQKLRCLDTDAASKVHISTFLSTADVGRLGQGMGRREAQLVSILTEDLRNLEETDGNHSMNVISFPTVIGDSSSNSNSHGRSDDTSIDQKCLHQLQITSRLLWGRRVGVILNEMCESEEVDNEIENEEDGLGYEKINHKDTAFNDNNNNNWSVYILDNPINRRTYIGVSIDPVRRLKQHNGSIQGGARYTRMHAKGSWRIHTTVSGLLKKEAMSVEKTVKNTKSSTSSTSTTGAMAPVARRLEVLQSLICSKYPHAVVFSSHK